MPYCAPRWSQYPGDDLEQRGFTRAVAAHDADDLAGLHLKGYVAQRMKLTLGDPSLQALDDVFL